MIDKTISHFQILEKIGEGGMGEVYLADDTALERKVALKFLPTHYTVDSEINARFKREAKAAAGLNHPNIITVYEVGEYEGQTYIAMEYIEGESLKHLINKEKLAIDKVLELAVQMCEGLREAHRAGIVHRDVKPENIMIDKRGSVKILDFGLAKLKDVTKLTKVASTLGTLLYMSPEQLQGMEVDQRTDIWSTGVVLYEMITQHLPFQGEYEASLMYSVLNEDPEPITSLRSEVPAKLEQIVNKALMKNADDRYQEIDELLADVKSGDEELPVVRKGVPTMKAKEPRRTSKGRIFAAAVSVMIVLAAMALYFSKGEKPTAEMKRVVVAVFENQTGDVSLDPLGRMAADWISQGLAQTKLMYVVPTTAVLASLHGLENDEHGVQTASVVPFLASETKSDIVVSGNYYQQGEMIQFQAQVMDLETNLLLGGLEPISKSREEVISAIGELKQQVMGALATHVDPRMKAFEHGISKPPNYQAYQEYVEGLVLQTRHDFHNALDHFYRAYELDSTANSALLYAAGCHLNMGDMAKVDSIVHVVTQFREQLTPFERSLLDWNEAYTRGDRDAIFLASKQMAEIAPTPQNLIQYAVDAVILNKPQEAISIYSQVDLEQGSLKDDYHIWDFLTMAHHLLGNHKLELQAAQRGRKLHQNQIGNLIYEIRALAALGRIEEVNVRIEQGLATPVRGLRLVWEMFRQASFASRRHGNRDAAFNVLNRAIDWLNAQPPEVKKKRSARSLLARSYYLAEMWDQADTLFKELDKDLPNNIYYLGKLGALAARRGERDQAVSISKIIGEMDHPIGDHTFERARIAALLDEREQAVTLLRAAFAQGYGFSIYPHSDIDLESLIGYPPFDELMQPKG